RGDLFRRLDFDGDFMELDLFLLETAAAHFAEDFAVTGLGRLQRDKHPVGGGLDVFLGFLGVGAFAARFHHADDFVVIAADADVFAEGRVEREEGFHHIGADDADVRLVVHFLVGKKPSAGDMMVAHLGIPGDGAHDLAVDAAADVPDIFAHNAARHDDGDAGDGGADAFDVGVGEAVLQDEALAAFFGDLLFLWRFDAAEDDVLA